MFLELQGEIEEETGEQYSDFEIIGCTSQVVAGTNYWVSIRTDKGLIRVKVFEPLPYTRQPASVVEVEKGEETESEQDEEDIDERPRPKLAQKEQL